MKDQGLSLLELLVTITIVSIVTVVALPATANWARQQDTLASVHLLTQSLALARQEAVTRQTRVSIVRNTSWQSGWQVFVDINGNATLDGEDTLIHAQMPLRNVVITGNGSMTSYVMYSEDGRSIPANSTGNAWVSGRLDVCANTSSVTAYGIVIARGGRVRIETANGAQPCL